MSNEEKARFAQLEAGTAIRQAACTLKITQSWQSRDRLLAAEFKTLSMNRTTHGVVTRS